MDSIKLIITDREEFDNKVFQTETRFSDAEYKKWFDSVVSTIYEAIGELDCSGSSIDVYKLGDLCNVLSNMKVLIVDGIEKNNILSDEFIYNQFMERGLFDDDDIGIFDIDTIIDYLQDRGFSVCKQ